MIRSLVKTILTLFVVLALIIGGAWFALSQTSLGNVAANAIISSDTVTSQIEQALVEHEDAIAQRLGVSVEEVETAVQDLDVGNWQAVDPPASASVENEFSVEYEGTSISATLYNDPEYVTVQAAGQEITFRIPESAQQYRALLQQ